MAGVHVAILAFVGVIAAFDPRSGDMASISSIRKYSLGNRQEVYPFYSFEIQKNSPIVTNRQPVGM
eukprot:1318488-Amorphochlora_amoeboformis.AAC.1